MGCGFEDLTFGINEVQRYYALRSIAAQVMMILMIIMMLMIKIKVDGGKCVG